MILERFSAAMPMLLSVYCSPLTLEAWCSRGAGPAVRTLSTARVPKNAMKKSRKPSSSMINLRE